MKQLLISLIIATISIVIVALYVKYFVVPVAEHIERHTIDISAWERAQLQILVAKREKELLDSVSSPVTEAQAAELNKLQMLETKLNNK